MVYYLSLTGTDHSLRPPRLSPPSSRPSVGQLPGSEAPGHHPPRPRPLRHQLALEDAGRREHGGGRDLQCRRLQGPGLEELRPEAGGQGGPHQHHGQHVDRALGQGPQL